ncbi:MAG: glucose 1-dehydrogenase, partial [Myxococcota bacterium]|nr:glucose 1-dehydrogenase [Myxococcota bacterium]
MSGRLQGKTAMITGGASGIGAATARLFIEEGAKVLVADLQADRGHALVDELGERAFFHTTDVRSEDQVQEAVDQACARFGALDIMFANAGIVGTYGPIDELPIDEWDFTMQVNLRGVVLCLKHAARVMKPQKRGVILSTSSIAGVHGGLGPHAYAAAKCALIGLTRNLASELSADGIRVNCIAPGNMATEMVADLVFKDPNRVDDIAGVLAQSSPLPGRTGSPDDIARAALFLASEE